MRLLTTITNLITEQASLQDLVDAVKNRKVMIIYYDGDEPGGKGLREIEPVCFGYSKSKNPVLRAWDNSGASHTGYKGEQPLPGWRLFRVDKILSFKSTGETFDEVKPGFNPNGDKGMVRILTLVSFDNPEQNIA